MSATRRLGVMGGTFDPPHIGHLLAAEMARAELNLERVLFVPANRSPWKMTRHMSTTEQRTLSGAAIGTAGGAVVGAITGDWAWAAACAAIGAAGGYIYDKEKEKQQAAQQAAYEKGVAAGKQQAKQQ